MAIYTWVSNKSTRDFTSRFVLNSGQEMLIGENADLSQEDLDELSPIANFVLGVVAVDTSNFPFRLSGHAGSLPIDNFYGYARLNRRGIMLDSTRLSDPDGSGGLDTGRVVDQLAKVANQGYGQVEVLDGIWSIDPEEVKVPAKGNLIGLGEGQTTFERTGDGCLIDVSGTSAAAKNGRTRVEGIFMDGNDFLGPLYRGYHVFEARIRDLRGKFSQGPFIDLANAWDCVWDGYLFAEWCGTKPDGTEGAVRVRTHAAASGFGFGDTDVTNMIKCLGHLRLENFRRGLDIERGAVASGDPYGIHFADVKMESSVVRAPFLRVSNVNDIRIDYCDITGNAKDSGSPAVPSSGIVPIFWAPLAQGVLEQVRAYTPPETVTANTDVFFNLIQSFHGANGRIGNVRFDGPSGPTSGFVMDWQSATPIDVGQITSQVGIAEDGGLRPPAPNESASVNFNATTMKIPYADFITIVAGAGGSVTNIPVVRRRRPSDFLVPTGVTLVDGGNLKLIANIVGPALVRMYCDGTNWNQVAPASVT